MNSQDINYTFIIPHKNSPIFLERCIQSIPYRDDIQIVVVDDNSSPDIVNWNNMPIIRQKNVELIIDTANKWAGHVRNVGIQHAKGKWLLFPDADDFYQEGFLNILDHHKDADADVIYFGFLVTDEKNNRLHWFKTEKYIDDYDGTENSLALIRYRINSPWCKMVNAKFRKKYDCWYEEQPIGNDIFFSLQIGHFARKIIVEKEKIYHYIYYKKSQTRKKWDSYKIQTTLGNKLKPGAFYKEVGHKEWAHGLPYILYIIFKSKDFAFICKSLWILLSKHKVIWREKNKYVNSILKNGNNYSNI